MSSHDRRAAGRRRAWGRGPIILKFDALEKRRLLAARGLPDLVGSAFEIPSTADWNDTIQASGQITNQGRGIASSGFLVDIFASSSPTMGANAVKVAEFEIPAGLAPGQSMPFNTTIHLPSSPLPGTDISTDSGQPVFFAVKVDVGHNVRENNEHNNQGLGLGYDMGQLSIEAHQPAVLVGTTLSVDSPSTTWGSSIQVVAQVQNQGAGGAPPTRARLVLTPVGALLGGNSDVTIANIDVPAIDAWQTTNIVQSITLPEIAPTVLSGKTQFALSLIEDADYQTDTLYPHLAMQGAGLDQAALQILPDPSTTTNPTTTARPELAASSVSTPAASLLWGQAFDVNATIQNIGTADAGPFRVFFVLVGASGSLTHAIYLGQTQVAGLQAGANQQITQAVQLPTRVPTGMTLDSLGLGKIAVVVDAENVIDEPVKTNNTTQSSPVILRVLGTDKNSVVPSGPKIALAPGKAGNGAGGNRPLQQFRHKSSVKTQNNRLYRRIIAEQNKNDSITDKIKDVPNQIGDFIKKIF
jgi:hypothetical protein